MFYNIGHKCLKVRVNVGIQRVVYIFESVLFLWSKMDCFQSKSNNLSVDVLSLEIVY